jgi:4-amino-4-deoxy-L-arabinose transferase-like glycosyltransferase
MLLSSVLVVWLGNFATPDMLLLAATILTFLCFWSGYSPDAPDQSPRDRWHVPVGLACGIGMLAKGPVAVVLPAATITAFLLWQRQARQLWNRRTLLGIAACAAVCTPWYLAVTVATRGAFASGFFLHNNMQRLYAPMEMHGGSFLYPSLALFAGFAPWSAFLLWMAASATKSFFTRKHDSANNCAATESSDFQSSPINKAPARLLICWSTAYLLVFSFSATKLPHYTAPVVPALAILLAQFLAQWCRRECSIPRWLVFFAAALIIIGGSLSVAIVGGAVRIPLFDEARGNMLHWALVASPVAILAIGLTWCARHGLRRGGVITLAACHVVTILLFASGVAPAFNRVKPICSLVNDASLNRPNDDIRIGSLLYTQPSVVFYSRREVKQLHDVFEAAEFLESPLPAYLLVAESHWNCVEPFLKDATTVICARCYDPFRRRHILVVSNQPDATALATASHDLD